jgi:hypothetical protein
LILGRGGDEVRIPKMLLQAFGVEGAVVEDVSGEERWKVSVPRS